MLNGMSEITTMQVDPATTTRDDEPMTAEEAPRLLRCSAASLLRHEALGLPVHRYGIGKRARKYYFRDELLAWVRSRPAAQDLDPAGRRRGRRVIAGGAS